MYKRQAYGAKAPRPTLRHQLVVALFTLFLMAVVLGTLALLLIGRGVLTFLARYLPAITPFIGLWNALRFPLMGVAFFLALGALYWVSPGKSKTRRRVLLFPGDTQYSAPRARKKATPIRGKRRAFHRPIKGVMAGR